MRLNLPESLTPHKVFYLMIMPKFPHLSPQDVDEIDLTARTVFEKREFERALPLEIMAARGHQILNSKYTDLSQGFCWDRAAKSAYELISADYFFALIETCCAYNGAQVYAGVLAGRQSGEILKSKRLSLAKSGLHCLGMSLEHASIELGAFSDGIDSIRDEIPPKFHNWFLEENHLARKIA